MLSSVAVLMENIDFDWEPLVRGFVKKDRRDTKQLLDRLRPLMKGLAASMRGGDDPIIDDWISDFVSKRLPKIAQTGLKNMNSKRYRAGQFPALVSASLRRFLLNKMRDSKLRKQREKEAGSLRGVQTDDPRSKSVDPSDKKFVANLVRKHIGQEKDKQVRDFLLHLTGLAKSSTLTFGQLTGGEINSALASAGLDANQWQKSGRATKARARLFDRLRGDKSFRKFAGVESESVYGPPLSEVVGVLHPQVTKTLSEMVDLQEHFYRWLMEALHG